MKKLSVFFTVFFMTFVLFAQEAPSCGLKDSDVKNFIKNYNKLERELDKYDVDLDEVNSLTMKDAKKIESILEKNGISGPNSFLKIVAISYGSVYVLYEDQLGKDAADSMFAQYKSIVNSKDLKVVQANKKELIKLFTKIADNDKDETFDEDDIGDFEDYANMFGNMKNKAKDKVKKDAKKSVKDKAKNKLKNSIPGGNFLDFLDDDSSSNNTKEETASRTDKEEVQYVKSFESKLKSSKKDIGPLYKKYDSKNAGKYKKAKEQTRVFDLYFEYPTHNPSENPAHFSFQYKNDLGDEPYAICLIRYFDSKGKLKEKKEIRVTVLSYELYESDSGFEVIYQTKEFGTIHFWSDYGDKNFNNKQTFFGNDGILIQGISGESVA